MFRILWKKLFKGEKRILNRATEPSTSAASSNDVCRLRHGLNVNCLLKVFEYLEFDDLTKLCGTDPYFKELITTWTIKAKMIKLPDLYLTNNDNPNKKFRKADHPLLIELFETFGKSMRKFTIRVDAGLSPLLELIIEYCEPDTLTEVVLYIDYPGAHILGPNALRGPLYTLPADQELFDRSLPFFSNLRKFNIFFGDRIWRSDYSESNEKFFRIFLTKILSSATNVQEIHVMNMDITGGWLKDCNNLRKLRIDCMGAFRYLFDDLATCLKMNANLKVFEIHYTGNDLIIPIGDALPISCPNLECFGEYHSLGPFGEVDPFINRYNFLSTLLHLKRVAVTSYTECCSDLHFPLKNLAKSNIVELTIFYCPEDCTTDENKTSDIMTRSLPVFTNIQTVIIISHSYRSRNGGFEFIFHLAKYLTNLKNLILRTRPIPDIHKIVEFAPSIRTLDLADWLPVLPRSLAGLAAFFDHDDSTEFKKSVMKIVETLRKIRQFNGDHEHLLNLKLNRRYKHLHESFADTKDIMIVSFSDRED